MVWIGDPHPPVATPAEQEILATEIEHRAVDDAGERRGRQVERIAARDRVKVDPRTRRERDRYAALGPAAVHRDATGRMNRGVGAVRRFPHRQARGQHPGERRRHGPRPPGPVQPGDFGARRVAREQGVHEAHRIERPPDGGRQRT